MPFPKRGDRYELVWVGPEAPSRAMTHLAAKLEQTRVGVFDLLAAVSGQGAVVRAVHMRLQAVLQDLGTPGRIAEQRYQIFTCK